MTEHIQIQQVINLLASWWYDYDEGSTDDWPAYFSSDVTYRSRTDSDASPMAEFVKSEWDGRGVLVAALATHRQRTPLPIRHICTNVHITASAPHQADFRCYVMVVQVLNSQASPISIGRCRGSVRSEEGVLRIAAIDLVFDVTDSTRV